ncbi:MAG: glycosyltransferase family 4 protein [Ignavibacteriae bacterium]|nr:glycosyltransferase family 4 protein [Ignavibacteriota bacterium]
MKIAFTSIFDIDDPNAISGTLYFISKYLQKHELDVIHIDKLDKFFYKFLKYKSVFHSINKKKYLRMRDPFFIKQINKQIERQIEKTKPDIILSQGSLEVSLLKCKQPIIIWCDGNFFDLINKHPHYKNLTSKTIDDSFKLEQMAYDKAALLLFPSEWAAQSTVNNYNVNPSKVKVVQYGANIENELPYESIKNKILSRPKDVIKILFSGVDWHYKGGDILIEAGKLLIDKGYKIEINIIGCNPNLDTEILKFTKVHGFLKKSEEIGNNLLQQLYLNSNFFVLPTRYETYGISFCEANAYGLPVFGTNTGGVPSIINNGINGYLIEQKDSSIFIAEKINYLFSNYEEYINLSISSYNEFKTRLNWYQSCQKVKSLSESILSK